MSRPAPPPVAHARVSRLRERGAAGNLGHVSSTPRRRATRLAVISRVVLIGLLVGVILLINREEGRLAEIDRPPAEEASAN